MNGWICLHRSIENWEWYTNSNTKALFIHLLITACFKDSIWQGVSIKRGQLVTSRASLSKKLGISERQLRVSLEHLKMTGEVTSKATSKYSIITVCNYDRYQDTKIENDQQNANTASDKRPAKRPTNDHILTIKQDNNSKAVESFIPEDNEAEPIATPIKRFTVPTQAEVAAYCLERKNTISPQAFLDHYTAKGWKIGNSPMKDWRAAVRTWESRQRQGAVQGSPAPSGAILDGVSPERLENHRKWTQQFKMFYKGAPHPIGVNGSYWPAM